VQAGIFYLTNNMKKMIGILMMGAGLMLLVSGYFVFTAKEKDFSKEEIEGQIQAVIADGVFTGREKEHIGRLAQKYSLNKEDIFAEIEERISTLEDEAETAIIDQAKKKGDDFEKYIVKKFDQYFFSIKQWAGDKYVDGIYSEITQQPDLVVEFHYKDYKRSLAVECKWRKEYSTHGIKLSYEDQLERYKKYEHEKNTDVYIVLGVGGKASHPESLYLIPLKDIDKPEISMKQLNDYRKDPKDNFYYSTKTGHLDIIPYK
jgi:hypothetical protein